MKRLISAICVGILLLTPMAGCKEVFKPGETAVEQIAAETKDPYILARAAYLDANTKFTTLVEKYTTKYQDYVIKKSPEIHNQIVMYLDKMDTILYNWDAVSNLGITPERGAADFTDYLEAITTLLLKVDTLIEDGELNS